MLQASQLPSMRGNEVEALFAKADAGAIPVGKGNGQALIATGTVVARPLLAFVRLVAWRGKEFDSQGRSLHNLISPFSMRAITALRFSLEFATSARVEHAASTEVARYGSSV